MQQENKLAKTLAIINGVFTYEIEGQKLVITPVQENGQNDLNNAIVLDLTQINENMIIG